MRRFRKIAALLLALLLMSTLTLAAFADEVGGSSAPETTTTTGSGTITISNAAKGVTYSIYKLFDATVGGGDAINYTGTIPESLNTYFTVDTAGNITATSSATTTTDGNTEMSEGLRTALKTWVGTQTTATATQTANGGTLTFSNLAYGYYVVTTTQGNQAISVTSTTPTASIIDKNTTTPVLTKTVEGKQTTDGETSKPSYSIGDTITYVLTFNAANYDGEEKITEYKIEDTLPDFLFNVTVTKITIGETEYKVDGNVPQFTNKEITISWVDSSGNHIYNNGVEVTVTYNATLTDKVSFESAGNKNKATLTYNNKTLKDDETVYSYSFDLVKTKKDGTQLTGAEFKLYDAQTGGNVIKLTKVEGEANVYKVDPSETDTNDTIVVSGKTTIQGLKSGTYYLEETKAPAGYNKLENRVEVKIENANLTASQGENGQWTGGVVVENEAGIQLPTTGGMGTTMFYVLGTLLVLAAVVLLVVRKGSARD